MSDLPNTMMALTLNEDGYSGRFEGPIIDDAHKYLTKTQIDVPSPKDGQVLIKMRTASINPSDLHFIKGEYGQPRIKGAAAGFEGCGDVVDGPKSLIGQRVAFVATPDGSGAWAEYAMTDAASVIPLRPDVSDDDGAAQIVNPLTAMAMMDMAAKAGDAVVITAATSQLGKLMIGLGEALNVKTIAVCRRENANDMLKGLGATEVIATETDGFMGQMTSVMAAHKPRMMLDAVSDQISEDIFGAMPSRSRWVSYGKLNPEPPVLKNMGQLIFMGKQIEGFWLTNWFRNTPPADQMRVVMEVQARFADGRWKTDVSHHIPLTELLEKLPEAQKTLNGKIIVTYD